MVRQFQFNEFLPHSSELKLHGDNSVQDTSFFSVIEYHFLGKVIESLYISQKLAETFD